MSINLIEWIERLQADVPARDCVPTDPQYEQAILDAVTDFNNRATRQKVYTIQITSGQATYSLPTDFLKFIRLTWRTAGDVIVTDQGIIPTSPFSAPTHHTINGLTISFYPTPQYAMPRDLWYGAGHVLSGEVINQVYAEMSTQEQNIIHLRAQYLALMKQANAATAQAWSYSLPAESINKVSLADKIREQAKELLADYLEKVKRLVGTQASRARYETY